jgi:hypothetical protein
MDFLKELYKKNEITLPEIDPIRSDRSVYLNFLGMAYIDKNIPPEYIELVAE